MKHILKISFIFFFVFFLLSNVYAGDDFSTGYLDPSKDNFAGYPGDSLNAFGAGWDGNHNKAYRLTLVDFSGKKIEGTRSVDFSSNDFFKCWVDGNVSTNKLPCKLDTYDPINVYSKNGNRIFRYGYKYTKKFASDGNDGDYSESSEREKFVYYDSKGKFKSQDSVTQFFKTGLLSTGWKYRPEWCSKDLPLEQQEDCMLNLSFYDMFLHYAGLLDDYTPSYKNLDSDSEKLAAVYNSVIIVEPIWPVYFKVNSITVHRYGTVTELAQYSYEHRGYGLDDGFHTTLRANISLCVNPYDKENYLYGFSAIESGVSKEQCNSASTTLDMLIDDKLAYGVGVGIIGGVTNDCLRDKECPPHPPGTPTATISKSNSADFTFNYCDGMVLTKPLGLLPNTDDANSNIATNDGGSIGFYPSSYSMTPEYLKENDNFKISSFADENQSIRCIDSVDYALTDLFENLQKKFNKFVFVNPRAGKLQVSRTCLLGKDYKENAQFNIGSYKNSAIEIKFYNNKYTIYPSDFIENNSFDITNSDKSYTVKPKLFDDSKIVFTKTNESSVDDNYTFVSYDFELYYVIPENLIFVGNGENDADAYIKLSDIESAFGYSQTEINEEFFKGTGIGLDSFKKAICPLAYEINNSAKTNINFRTISLRNPFPARDGTSRLPAENWLSITENNVYNYITNNRGVMMIYGNNDPELMYSVREPMYTVTLTPSIMLNIRKYNKMYSYYSMYKLEDGFIPSGNISPNDENADKLICNSYGRECYSQFLRDDKYLPQQDESSSVVGGACFLGRNTSDDGKIRSAFNTLYHPSGLNSDDTDFTKEIVSEYLMALNDPETYNERHEDDANSRLNHALDFGKDVNFNGRFDSEDIEIMLLYSRSNDVGDELYGKYRQNAYYTCAHKSFKSGGPIEEVEE